MLCQTLVCFMIISLSVADVSQSVDDASNILTKTRQLLRDIDLQSQRSTLPFHSTSLQHLLNKMRLMFFQLQNSLQAVIGIVQGNSIPSAGVQTSGKQLDGGVSARPSSAASLLSTGQTQLPKNRISGVSRRPSSLLTGKNRLRTSLKQQQNRIGVVSPRLNSSPTMLTVKSHLQNGMMAAQSGVGAVLQTPISFSSLSAGKNQLQSSVGAVLSKTSSSSSLLAGMKQLQSGMKQLQSGMKDMQSGTAGIDTSVPASEELKNKCQSGSMCNIARGNFNAVSFDG